MKSPQPQSPCAVKGQKKRSDAKSDSVKKSVHRYYRLRLHPGMVVLKHAIGRLGDLQASYDAVLNEIWNFNQPFTALGNRPLHEVLIDDSYRLVYQLRLGGAQPFTLEEFICVIRIITAPMDDNSDLSAIQYAAQCGRHEMVRNYLGLLVLSCLVSRRRQVKKNTSNLSLTIEGWFDYLGYPSGFFDKNALRLCVAESLNEETKQVLESNTYTMETILKTTSNIIGGEWPFDVDALLQGTAVATKTPTTKTKTARPVLRVNDLSKEDPHIILLTHEDAAEDIFSEHLKDWEEEEENSAEEDKNSSYHGSWGEDAASNVEFLQTAPGDSYSFIGDHDNDVENTLSVEILNLAERETVDDISTDWSILSEVSSVVSFERTMVRSFKEVLVGHCGIKARAVPVREAQPSSSGDPKTEPAIQGKLSKKASEDTEGDNQDGFDAYFIMHGFKGARGGRSSRMFKGNSKTLGWLPRKHRLEKEVTSRTHTSRCIM
jgi:hypothetical protein